jgi:hypothetical protein
VIAINIERNAPCRSCAVALLQSEITMNRFLHMVWAPAAFMLAIGARADAETQREDEFKAAYVFNFVKFVEWPQTVARDAMTICFAGAEGVHQALAASLENKRIGARRLVALQIGSAPDSEACHVLYIDAALVPERELGQERALLTISDASNFVANGGMIELFTENHRLRFRVNVDSAQRAGLRISSNLLKLAAGVHRESR